MAEKANPGCRNCKKCRYQGQIWSSHLIYCDYLSITGRLRGGHPEDCTKFDPIRSGKAARPKALVVTKANDPVDDYITGNKERISRDMIRKKVKK